MSTGDVLCDESAGCEMKRDIRSVLVVCTRRIGDVLLATPVVRSLKRAYPEAAIDMLVFEGTQDVVAANPDVHRTLDDRRTSGDWPSSGTASFALASIRPGPVGLGW